jgi:dihydroflavonol-4-reductase
MIVVTGATGHLGNVLVRELLKDKEKVRALVLPEEDLTPLKNLNVELVQGDILNAGTLEKAFKGARYVYHLAGVVSIERGKKALLERVNVEGTKNVMRACRKAGVKRLIYTSTVHAFAHPGLGQMLDERQPFDPKFLQGNYDKSKARASLAVQNAAKHGLDAVIVCPSGVIGPYDFKISQMGQLAMDFSNRRLKAYIEGAYDFVDVRDVARGHILAAKKGRKGEAYILSGERITITRLFAVLKQATKEEPPHLRFPRWVALAVAPFAYLHYKVWKLKPLFTGYSIKTLTSKYRINHDNAAHELGYAHRPVEESILDSVAWLKREGYL